MSRILLLGVGPLPTDPGDRLFAPGLRVQQFAKVLADAGHNVTMLVSQFGESSGSDGVPDARDNRGAAGPIPALGERVEVRRITFHPVATLETVSTLLFTGGYDALVSTTDIMNDLSARLEAEIPRWMDINGDPFAEKQMQAATHNHDGSLMVQWPLMLNALSVGDRFSVCSASQASALAGQLAFAGRLNGATDGEPLIHVIQPASRAMLDVERKRGPQARPVSLSIPADAFKVLWTGGYNTWADVQTLFAGLELAMAANPRVHFVSTGGAIAGHDTSTAARFQALVSGSEFRERYHFLGWVPTRDIPYVYRLGDLALNVDRKCYEGELGMRNRIVDWTLFEVPVATTVTCDLAEEMARLGLVERLAVGDARNLAEAILRAIDNGAEFTQRAARAREWFDSAYPEAGIFRPLTEWAEAPARARDRELAAERFRKANRRRTAGVGRDMVTAAVSLVNGRLHEWRNTDRPPGQGRLVRLFRRLTGRA